MMMMMMKFLRSCASANQWDNCNGVTRVSVAMLYCTQTLSSSNSKDTLFKRISLAGDPRVSMFPILDQWVEGGRAVGKAEIKAIIKLLRKYKRFNHALQLSEWMSHRWNHAQSPGDIAVKLDLVSKVHGLEQAEKYFSNIPETLRTFRVYGALLNCYANGKSLEKAETIMQKMREFRILRASLSYNVMLNLYSKRGKQDKFDALIQEMEEKGISCYKSTLYIRLNTFASVSDTRGMEKLLTQMEGDPQFNMDWNAYVIAANGYLKAGLVEKGFAMLRKSEQYINGKRRWFAYEMILTLYAHLGNKEEVYHIWNLYKQRGKVYNRVYSRMISSLVKLDDLDGAKKILAEWESVNTSFDFDIPNLLINAYCKRGLLEKAEAYISRIIEQGKEPTAGTWDHLATGYYKDSQMAKAVDAMKKAIGATKRGWELNRVTLRACLEYLERNGDKEVMEEFTRLLSRYGHLSEVTKINIKKEKYCGDIFDHEMEGNDQKVEVCEG